MTKKQIENLASGKEVFTWTDTEEGSVKVTIISKCDSQGFCKVRRTKSKPGLWDVQDVPINKIFLTEKTCERDCLKAEEEYEKYEEMFFPLDVFLAYLLIACRQGRKMEDAEYAAAINRASNILGFDMFEYIGEILTKNGMEQ